MAVEASLRSKALYKIQLYLLKVIPMVMAFICLLNSTLSYFDIDLPILSYIVGNSILTIVYFYITSYVLRFCSYHRMFMHYTTVTWIINIADLYVGIPIGDLPYLLIQLIVAGICLFLILYLYVKSHKKPTSKDSK